MKKMKNKLPKEKHEKYLNESSSTFVAPSFSTITFRKKGHYIEDIGEEVDVSPNGQSNDQSNWPGNNLEYPKVKKKRKKKNSDDGQCSDIIHNSKEGFTDEKWDEDKAAIELGVESESPELNCPINNAFDLNVRKKKKFKENKNVAVVPLHKLTEEYITDRNHDEKPFVESGEGFKSKELNYSAGSLDDSYVLKKKKKKNKHLSEDSLLHMSLSTEDVKMDKDNGKDTLEAEFPVKKSQKKKHKKFKFVAEKLEANILHNNHSPLSNGNPSILPDINLQNKRFSGCVESFPNPTSKKNKSSKRKHTQSGEYIQETDDSTYSPLFKKKKKPHTLMDESILNISSNEPIQRERSGTENNVTIASDDLVIPQAADILVSPSVYKKKRKTDKLSNESNVSLPSNKSLHHNVINTENKDVAVCEYLNIAQDAQLDKKPKKNQWSNDNFDTKHESLMNNSDCNEIRNSDRDASPTHSTKKKQISGLMISQPESSLLVTNSHTTKLDDFNKTENNSQLKKKHKKHKNAMINDPVINSLQLTSKDHEKTEGKDSQNLKSLVPELKRIKFTKRNKNKQSKENTISEENLTRLCDKSVKSPDGMNVATVTGTNEAEHTNEKNHKQVNYSKQNIALPKKKTEVKIDVESLRNQLLREALSGTEESEDLPSKSTKLKAETESVNTIRRCLLKESVNETKELKVPKSTKIKPGGLKKVDAPRNHLLKVAIGGTKEAEKNLLKPNKINVGFKESIDNLRERLLKEANIGTEKAKCMPPKSTKVKTDNKKSDKVNSLNKDHKMKKDFNKDELKKKHKKKCKLKNDIDVLTNILISKALERVSNSCASHSPQENIDFLNVDGKVWSNKKSRVSGNNIVKVKPPKYNHSKQSTTKVLKRGSKQESELEKMQKALLNDAVKRICPEFKSSKTKLKKKT